MSNLLSTRGFLTLSALSLLLLAVKANANGVNKPPFEIPFYPAKVGDSYTFQVQVVDQLTYSIDVRFYITLPNKWSHFFDKQTPEESGRLADILGTNRIRAESGAMVQPGVPAQFRVQIIRSKNQEPVLDEVVEHPKTNVTYMGRSATLAKQNLEPDIYTIRVDYLAGAPELAPLHAKILFARAHHGK